MEIAYEDQCFYCRHYKPIFNVHDYPICPFGEPSLSYAFKCPCFDFNLAVKVGGPKHKRRKANVDLCSTFGPSRRT